MSCCERMTCGTVEAHLYVCLVKVKQEGKLGGTGVKVRRMERGGS